MSKKLSLLDLAFFVAESEASPKHVAGLLIFKRPARSSVNFAHDLYEEYLTRTDVKAPFNKVIKFSLTGMPYWKDCASIDLNQHIFYHKLEKGQNSREQLYQLVSQLHEPRLARCKPLWEIHIIDGLENGRFGLYQKMHHACADGITMMRWTANNLSETADDMELEPIWCTPRTSRRQRCAARRSLHPRNAATRSNVTNRKRSTHASSATSTCACSIPLRPRPNRSAMTLAGSCQSCPNPTVVPRAPRPLPSAVSVAVVPSIPTLSLFICTTAPPSSHPHSQPPLSLTFTLAPNRI